MTRITLPEAMTSPEAQAVFAALGGDKQTRFVGGAVRNAILGEEIGDIDLATMLPPLEAMRRLRTAGIKVIPTGIDHGTITAVLNDKVFEITTLRKDVATDGRWAVVAFTDDWAQDAQRRDFTMNALFADLSGRIYDPLGHGIDDLEKRKVIFVGDPFERIEEDYLRALRFFRFHARYGKGKPDAKALAACADAAGQLKSLSKERVTQEFVKLVSAPKCSGVLSLMKENNILGDLIQKKYDPDDLTALIKRQKEFQDWAFCARLSLISTLDALQSWLILPKRLLEKVAVIPEAVKTLKRISGKSITLSLYLYGHEATVQALYIRDADPEDVKKALSLEIPVFPLSGKDLMAQGMKAGPALGDKLEELERAWIESGFKMKL